MAKTWPEFQSERDLSQPKWMQESSTESSRASSQRRPEPRPAPKHAPNVTDEAAMLDAPRQERPSRPPRPATVERLPESPARGRSPAGASPYRPNLQPKFMQQVPPEHDRRPLTKLSRQDVEDQTAQAYPAPSPAAGSSARKPMQDPSSSRPSSTIPASRPLPRSIPSVSSLALSTSAQHRKNGGEAFKRGDYAAAHEQYSSALAQLPPTHPISIIILSNRTLTALKTGDAKTAVADADRALALIGPANGAAEQIDLCAGEGVKEMRDFYGKALLRKAEALEHLERWTDAAAVWRLAIQAGVGGAASLRGRDRCEKAAAPQAVGPVVSALAHSKASKPISRATPPPKKGLGSSAHRPALTPPVSAEAVKKLRAAHAAAERVDDEKFALTDVVDARLMTWQGGKTENLRALLQSLDAVLWEGAGWKKVGMSDLVLPGKVKVVYMRAIAKVHPDKISQDATTEQRMISAAVFSTLNEAWEKFKTDNSL